MPFRHAVTLGLAVPLVFTGAACGVAFSAGTEPAKAPVAFSDVEREPEPGEREDLSKAVTRPVPTVGVSLVVNGKPFDAKPLPPPPIPVVVLP
jgi:hypothetical protein